MIFASLFVSLMPLFPILALLYFLMVKEKAKQLDRKEKNYSLLVYSVIFVPLLLCFIFFFIKNYNQSSYAQKQVKQASQVVKEYNQTISLAPKLQYADFLYKLKKGDFVTYQEVYSNKKDKYIPIYTDKYGQKFHPLMIQNAENNSNLSEYYKEIRILNSFSDKVDFNINNFFILNDDIAFYCNNREAFQDFFPSKKKESNFFDIDCSIVTNQKLFFF